VPHLFWRCNAFGGRESELPQILTCLLDNGCHLVLIDDAVARCLHLHCFHLKNPEPIELALKPQEPKTKLELDEFVWLELYDPSLSWKAKKVCALVAPGLCSPVILGLPFLATNEIVIDHTARPAVNKRTGLTY
jgi:hypothetical protein